MDNQTKEVLLRWGPVMLLFLAIACVCLAFIFAPVKLIVIDEDPMGERGQGMVYAGPAISVEGLLSRGESWKKYPDYNIGLGIAAGLSFVGALWTIARMYGENRRNEEP